MKVWKGRFFLSKQDLNKITKNKENNATIEKKVYKQYNKLSMYETVK